MIKREPGDLRQTITHRVAQRFFVRWHMTAILVGVLLSGVVCSALLLNLGLRSERGHAAKSPEARVGDMVVGEERKKLPLEEVESAQVHRRIETAGPDELARFSDGSRVAHGGIGAAPHGGSAGRAENHDLKQLM